MLIDGGPDETSSSKLAAFLKQHNVDKIDYMVLSHPHDDHYSGLSYVANAMPVSHFYDTRATNPKNSNLAAFRQKLSSVTTYPTEDDMLDWDSSVSVKVLQTCSTPFSTSDGAMLNNCSMVLHITYRNTSMLFTGDIQSEAEYTLVTNHGDELKSDILKVPHHGSAGSSTISLLNKVQPKFAFIEVGAGNTYGHPTKAAISRLQAAGAKIYRTDTQGTQKYTISATAPIRGAGKATYNWTY